MKYFHVGWHKFCNQGWLAIWKEENSDNLFVECEECMVQYKHPEDITISDAGAIQKYEGEDYASIEEIEKAGWKRYVQSETPLSHK